MSRGLKIFSAPSQQGRWVEMKRVYPVFTRELGQYFNTPLGFIYIDVFVLVTGFFFFELFKFFTNEQASLRGLFTLLPWVYLFFVPAVSMRLLAEDKKIGTVEVLMTLPLRDWEVVLAKYFAAFIFVTIALLLTFPLVIVVARSASPGVGLDYGPIIGGYLGAILMGAAFLAVGIFFSSLTDNQIVAFILSVVAMAIFLLIGIPEVAEYFPPALQRFVTNVSLVSHFYSIGRGVIDSRDMLYYLSIIFLFVVFTIRSVESRKWKA
jgi:ABC-2 type transport system permease protein